MSLSDDSRRLAARLDALPPEIIEALRPALVRSADEVAANMTALAPRDEGDLVASIAVTPPGGTTPPYAAGGGKRTAGPNQSLVTVGNEEVRYSHIVEFGRLGAPGQPFMRPSWRIARPKIERRLKRAISAAIKRVTG